MVVMSSNPAVVIFFFFLHRVYPDTYRGVITSNNAPLVKLHGCVFTPLRELTFVALRTPLKV